MSFRPAYEVLGDPAAPSARTAFILHGIFGSGRNWRSFGLTLVEAVPTWRVVLVDLRNHGRSTGAAAPHTLEACARDLAALAGDLGGVPGAVLGHSFGGKVALASVPAHLPGLRQLWLLDSPPGPGPAGGKEPEDSEVGRVIRAMRNVRLPVARRSEAADTIGAAGVSRGVANWMATNLQPVPGGGFSWHFDLDALEAMLGDYWKLDGWRILEAPPEGLRIHAVRAARSDRWTPVDIDRLAGMAGNPSVQVHILPDAGHWLQIDNPEGLLRIVRAGLG